MKKSICLLLMGLAVFFLCVGVFSAQSSLPDAVTLVKGGSCLIRTGSLIYANEAKTKTVFSEKNSPRISRINDAVNICADEEGSFDVNFELLGFIPIKTLNVNVCDNDCVIPGGQVVGIKIHADGVMVIALCSITDKSGISKTPARDAGLSSGDVIVSVNGEKIRNTAEFAEAVSTCNADFVTIGYVRDGESNTCSVCVADTGFDKKIGAWVRDSTAGLGTLTFVRPGKNVYAALGHGISDVDTSKMFCVLKGSITDCAVSTIKKGSVGSPGEIKGIFKNETFADIKKNSACGIYGIWTSDAVPNAKPIKVASRFEIHEGPAFIRFAPNGGEPKQYSVNIEKVYVKSNDEKGMLIRITDQNLIGQTGGIVRGMSGSPIIQDGKLIGAITHVLVNDPTLGYGIFSELMMDYSEQTFENAQSQSK